MPDSSHRRPSPEELLRRVEAEESYRQRGKLKVFLGCASGVGKTFCMLDEGRRRKMRGEDVVVASIQPSASSEVQELLSGLEEIPPFPRLGSPAIDVPAVLRRRPGVCLIDGLAYQNPPGSPHTVSAIGARLTASATLSSRVRPRFPKRATLWRERWA